jgi:Tfp pilus assembly protein PilE
MSKVPTYSVNNIILIVLSVPAFALFIAGVSILLQSPSGWTMPVAIACSIAFTVSGTVLGLRSARKVRHMAASGQQEEGRKYSKRVHKYFLGIFIITWILGILSAIYIPSYAAYRSRGYNIMAQSDLKNFYTAAERYFQKNPEGTINVELAKQYGFKPTYDVKLEVRSGQRFNFKATASHPQGTEMYTISSEGEIAAVKQAMPDR